MSSLCDASARLAAVHVPLAGLDQSQFRLHELSLMCMIMIMIIMAPEVRLVALYVAKVAITREVYGVMA